MEPIGTRLPAEFQALLRPVAVRRLYTWSVVLVFAGLAAVAVIGFGWMSDEATKRFWTTSNNAPWLPLLWTPLCATALAWATQRFAVAAAGSGIPQVVAAIDASADLNERGTLLSLPLALKKALLTTGGALAGLGLGREGPSVQIGAAILRHASKWLPAGRDQFTERNLVIAGAAAGVAAAFSTPLGGVVFAIEQLKLTRDPRARVLIIACAALAGLTATVMCGDLARWSAAPVSGQAVDAYKAAVTLALLGGVVGGCLSCLVIASLAGKFWRLSALRSRHPALFAGACGLVIASIGVGSSGITLGGGELQTRALLGGDAGTNMLFVPLKLIATWLAAWTGTPGGLFTPSLAIGAALGNDVAHWFHLPSTPALVGLGMACLLAGLTQAPLTAAVVVMEMIGGQSILIALLCCATIASIVSRQLSPPLYATLAELQISGMRRLRETRAV